MLFGRSISRGGGRTYLPLASLALMILTSCSEHDPYRAPAPPDTTPPVITSGPDVSLTQTGVTLTWTTDELSHDLLQISANGDFSSAILHVSPALVTDHALALEYNPNRYGEELTPGVAYQFRIRSTNEANLSSAWVTGAFTFQPDPS